MKLEDIEYKIANLHLSPGDILVIKCNDRATYGDVRPYTAIYTNACAHYQQGADYRQSNRPVGLNQS